MFVSIILFLIIILITLYIHKNIHGKYPEPLERILPYLKSLNTLEWNKFWNQNEEEEIPTTFNDYDDLIIETPTFEIENNIDLDDNEDTTSIVSLEDENESNNTHNEIIQNKIFQSFLNNKTENNDELIDKHLGPMNPSSNQYDNPKHENSREQQIRVFDPPSFVNKIGNNMVNVDPGNERNLNNQIHNPTYTSFVGNVQPNMPEQTFQPISYERNKYMENVEPYN
jgi:hypothetical protein